MSRDEISGREGLVATKAADNPRRSVASIVNLNQSAVTRVEKKTDVMAITWTQSNRQLVEISKWNRVKEMLSTLPGTELMSHAQLTCNQPEINLKLN